MYVGLIMHTDLITVSPDTSLMSARKLLAQKRIDHLLVVEGPKKLVGLVSDRDVKQSWASSATALSKNELNYLLEKVTLADIMIKEIFTVEPKTTIERAALVMQENRISALPVMDGGNLVGIITTTDVMRVLLQAVGIDDDSTRITLVVADRIGVMADLSQQLKNAQINMRSLFAWPDQRYPGFYLLVIRVSAAAGDKAVALLRDSGYQVLDRYVDDLSPYLPRQ